MEQSDQLLRAVSFDEFSLGDIKSGIIVGKNKYGYQLV
jgi:hypothetical protein